MTEASHQSEGSVCSYFRSGKVRAGMRVRILAKDEDRGICHHVGSKQQPVRHPGPRKFLVCTIKEAVISRHQSGRASREGEGN